MYKSVAYWPRGTFPYDNDVTTDKHNNKESALAVCRLLETEGNGRDKPVWTDVVKVGLKAVGAHAPKPPAPPALRYVNDDR